MGHGAHRAVGHVGDSDDEGSHHLGVFVFEDVAVVDVAAWDVEPDGDFDDVAGIDSDDVVPAVDFAGSKVLAGFRRSGTSGAEVVRDSGS